MNNLNVGDRVKIITQYHEAKIGYNGTIIDITGQMPGLEIDELTTGHDCDGMAKKGKGYYVPQSYLKLTDLTLKQLWGDLE